MIIISQTNVTNYQICLEVKILGLYRTKIYLPRGYHTRTVRRRGNIYVYIDFSLRETNLFMTSRQQRDQVVMNY